MNFVWAPWQCCGYKLKWFGSKFLLDPDIFCAKPMAVSRKLIQIRTVPDQQYLWGSGSEKLSSIFIEWFLNSLSLLSDEGTIFKCAILKWKKTYTQYIKIWKITFSPPPPLFSPLIYNSVWNTYTQRYPHIMWGL